MSWTRYLIVLGSIGACVLLAGRELLLLPDGKLHWHVFDVDQGDAMLIVTPQGKQMLIDGGPNMQLLEHLGTTMPFFDRTIELLVLTHPDADHITALAELTKRYRVLQVLMAGTVHNSGRYEALLHEIAEQNIPVLLANPEQDIQLEDGIVLDILWPQPDVFGSNPTSNNSASVVLRVLYGEHSLLLTGDIEAEAEAAILASGAEINSTILKVAHHGSKTSSSTDFILAASPKLAIVSAGRDNRHGHPHWEVLNRFQKFGIPVFTTANKGTIHLSFNTDAWKVIEAP